MSEENINGFAWKIGWHPWLTTFGVTTIAIIMGAIIKAIAPLAAVGFLGGFGLYFYGTRVVNRNYEDLLERFISQTERSAARGIDVANSSTYSLTRGNTSSPLFVTPSSVYRTTALVVTGTSVNINQGAKYKMPSRTEASGGSNRELFYDQITSVQSHQDGNYSTLEIQTSGGESIEVGSGATDTVDTAISEVRKRLREVKSGRNQSMGQPVQQQSQQQSEPTEEPTQSDTGSTASSDGSSGGDDTSSEPTATEACTACNASIDPTVAFCPSCGAESPLDDTVSRASTPSTDTGTEDVATSPAVVEATERVEQRVSPESSAATRLCQTLSNPDASDGEIQSALEVAVEELETAAAVTEAVSPAKRRSTLEVFETMQENLGDLSGDLPAGVTHVVDRLVSAKRELDQQEDTRSDVAASVETICRAAERSDAISFQHRDVEQRAEQLEAALQSDDIAIVDQAVSVPAVADDVDRRVRPTSQQSRALLTELREPTTESALSETITETVSMLDEYGETREMLADISVSDVKRRLDSLDRELQGQDTPAHSRLSTRVRELTAMIDEGSVDDIQLYAIYQEVSFYDRTLVPELGRGGAGGSSVDTDALLGTVKKRIRTIENDYVAVRADHNHSIPRHFLELCEELTVDAERAVEAQPERAAGVLLATESILDHVESLYERNEYSVMLRRLRG